MAALPGLTVRGLTEIEQKIKRLGRDAPKAAARGLIEEANAILYEADPLVPKDHGILRNTATHTAPKQTVADVSLEAGYGSVTVDYAAVQHENLTFRHRVGQAKYLATVVQRRAREFPRTIGRALDRAIQRLRSR